MPIEFKSVKGYYYLDAWVMAHIIHLATISFCRRFLNKGNDPGGRLYGHRECRGKRTGAHHHSDFVPFGEGAGPPDLSVQPVSHPSRIADFGAEGSDHVLPIGGIHQ